jgi:hypothetical protein
MAGQEELRLMEADTNSIPWRQWGPYLSERQWGTVREDYSRSGSAWDYFSHDQARSRAYRWGEDGLAGISDDRQLLCFSIALWNGADPILKERLFGLTNDEGNHGEDVKEYYFYLDSTPTHSYMKYLYKYPQGAYPYQDIVTTNRTRNRQQGEFELLDTGIFDDNRYFDVLVEYAKAGPEDILIRISISNRGPGAAELVLLPTLWFRNTWSWPNGTGKPALKRGDSTRQPAIATTHPLLGDYALYCEGAAELLFTENETNTQRVFDQPNVTPYVKDGINNYIVNEQIEAVNPAQTGTKAAARYHLKVGGGETSVVQLRLAAGSTMDDPIGPEFARTFALRQQEADEFYDAVIPANTPEDERNVMRQALAGMLWSKQFYRYDVDNWLKYDPYNVPSFTRASATRNQEWHHMTSGDIISMPDKWEYPWFAAWDLAFHTIPLAMVDPTFAKAQLELMIGSRYMHPNGALPAYEWALSDVNPPVHAWAAIRVYLLEKQTRGEADVKFLKRVFKKLLLNFTWWVNRKDAAGNSVFEGGFLGLDNIGVFDRSASLPNGGYLEQADGTGWMALYCLDMLTIAVELSVLDDTYEDLAIKFYEHFLQIAYAMDRVGLNADELWDEEDGFYYDLLHLPNGEVMRLKTRSMVGLLPIIACANIEEAVLAQVPRLRERMEWYQTNHPEFSMTITNGRLDSSGDRRCFSVITEHKLRRILARMLDETRFLSDYGIRALSRYHKDNPYVFTYDNATYTVAYEPAESSTGMFGGNSNWRGPIWMPVNALLLEALLKLYRFYGDDFKIECPTNSGHEMTLFEVATEIGKRLTGIFVADEQGRRAVYGGTEKFQTDPYWHDLILFYEYFHGDNGAGIGASHQTGWTGLIARIIQFLEVSTGGAAFYTADRDSAYYTASHG